LDQEQDVGSGVGSAGADVVELAAVAQGDVAVGVGPLRVFRTAELVLFHAASCRFRYSSWTSCGVRYPSAEWRRFRL
jgi:hypothetical protein